MTLRRVLPSLMIIATACSDSGPETGAIDGQWRLTSVNTVPLPASGNTIGDGSWLGAVLRVDGRSGSFDRCLQVSPIAVPTSQSSSIVVSSIGDSRYEVSYFDRRDALPDTATVDQSQLTLRYRNILAGEVQGVDVLTFVPLEDPFPTPCSLAP